MANRAPVNKKVKGKDQSQVEMVGLDMGKVPPQAIDIEEAVLGHCFWNRMPRST